MDDRISNLPESLILHILSFLNMRAVVKTSMLSRRWRHLWTSVPVLNFHVGLSDDPAFIYISLMLYDCPKIQRFCVDLHCKVNSCHIDSWARFAVRHNVEELHLLTWGEHRYGLPSFVLDYGALRVLELGYCVLDRTASSCFRSLTTLHLWDVEMTDLDTSGCPLLQNLIIEDCLNNLNLNIHAPNEKLRYFKFYENPYVLLEDASLTLYAPYLLVIEFTGGSRHFYNLKNVSSVRSASLDISSGENESVSQLLMVLLNNLGHAKTIALSRSCIKTLAYREGEGLKTPLLSATCLELVTILTKSNLTGIASLLRSSHCLETLIIDIRPPYNYSDDHVAALESWELLELALSSHLELKNVMIHNFLGTVSDRLHLEPEPIINMDKFIENWADEIKLVMILLRCCKMLDKLSISTIKMPTLALESVLLPTLTEKLVVLPRASVNAEIYFSWNSAVL